MIFLNTLRTCWRELLLLVLLGLGLGFVSDFVTKFGLAHGDITGLAFLDRTMKGVSTFASVMCTGGILGMFLWPSLSHFGNNVFVQCWQGLSDQAKVIIYISATFFSCLIAAICFSIK